MKKLILLCILLLQFTLLFSQRYFSLKHYPYSSFGVHDASLKVEFKNHFNPVKYKIILGAEIIYNNGRFDVSSDSIIFSDSVYNVSFDPLSGMFEAFKAYAIDSITNDTLAFIKSRAMIGNANPGYQRVDIDFVNNSLVCLGAFQIDSMTYTSNSGYWNNSVVNELYHKDSFNGVVNDTIMLHGRYSKDSLCHGYYHLFSPTGFETSFYIDSVAPSSFNVDIETTNDYNNCNGTATAACQSIGPFRYSWDNSGFGPNSMITNLCHGNHTLSVINGVGDTITSSFVIQKSIEFNISTIIDSSNCSGLAMVSNYSGYGPFQYSWDNNSYGADTLVSNLCVGNHTLSIVNSIGDTLNSTFFIDSVDRLLLAVSPDTSNCSGDAFAFANGNVDQYIWNGDVSNNTPQALGLCGGYNYVTVIYSNGDTISRLFEIEDLAFTTSVDIITFPDTLACSGSANAFVSSNTGPFLYSWDNNVFQSNFTKNGLCRGVHYLSVANSLGDTVTKGFYIDSVVTEPQVDSLIFSDVVINVTNYFSCYSSAQAQVNSNSGPFYYSWNGGVFGVDSNLDSICPAINTLRVANSYGDTVSREFYTNSIAFLETQPNITNCNGRMKVKILSSTDTFMYSLDGVNFTQDSVFENLCTQNYTLFVSNTNHDTVRVGFTIEQFRVGIYTTSDTGSCNGSVIVDHNAFNSVETLISYDGGVNGLMGGLTFEDSLCEGLHYVWIYDGIVGTDTIVLPYGIASSENTWGQYSINGTVTDSISLFADYCAIDYQIPIDSSIINSLIYVDSNNAELNVSVWQLGNEIIFIDTVFVPNASQGLFRVSVTFYCSQKSSNDVYKIVGVIELSEDVGTGTNMEMQTFEPEMLIYPNPTNGLVYFNTNVTQYREISLFNCNGELVLVSNEEHIDLSSFPKGLYFVKYRSNNFVKTFKLIKE